MALFTLRVLPLLKPLAVSGEQQQACAAPLCQIIVVFTRYRQYIAPYIHFPTILVVPYVR